MDQDELISFLHRQIKFDRRVGSKEVKGISCKS